MSKICVNMVVKNEEQYIGKCLEQLSKLADNILIIDTGSTDKTSEIIRQTKCQYVLLHETGEIRYLRNKLLKMSKGYDWIWIVDGDEVYNNKHLEKVASLMKRNDKKAFDFSFRHFMQDEHHEAKHYSRTTRLIKNSDDVKWVKDFPIEILVDSKGWISSRNRQRNDVEFVDIKYLHYGGLKKQWRTQPKKFQNIVSISPAETSKEMAG